MRLSRKALSNAFSLICVFKLCLRVAVVHTLEVYTIPVGETANLLWGRSEREPMKEFKEYRAWRDNISFAIITKGSQTAECPDDVLKQFCLFKIEFKIWNITDLILKVKNTTFNDSGDYSVEHVFGGMEGNHRDNVFLKIEAKPTGAAPSHDLMVTSSTSSSAQSAVPGANMTLLPTRHTSDLMVTSSTSSSAQSAVPGANMTMLIPTRHTSVSAHATTSVPSIDAETADSADDALLNQATLYGLTIGLSVLVFFAVLALVCWCRKKKRPKKVAKLGSDSDVPYTLKQLVGERRRDEFGIFNAI